MVSNEINLTEESWARQVAYAVAALFLLFVAVNNGPVGFVIITVWIGASFSVARAAEAKGRSYAAWFWIALCFTIPAAIAIACMKRVDAPPSGLAPFYGPGIGPQPMGYVEPANGPAPGPTWAAAQASTVSQPYPMKVCPACAEQVQAAAILCRYCGSRFDGGPAPA